MKCVICSEKITADPFGWDGGCNAEPVKEGQCCYRCDIDVVLPARLMQYGYKPSCVPGMFSLDKGKGAE